MNRITSLMVAISCFGLSSCGGDDPATPPLSTEKSIISFSIDGVEGTIDQNQRTVSLTLVATDFTSLSPIINISDKASIDPPSDEAQDFTNAVTYTVTAEDGSEAVYTATVSSGIIQFSIEGKDYELVQANLNWEEAAAFAVNRGGELARIDNEAEQEAIFNFLDNASINLDNSIAPDGGEATYVWIGGSDLVTEGSWIWDGNNDQEGDQFWEGLQDGSPVGDLYNNWGIEPDDFGIGQDALGLALTDWQLGLAGQWNDLDHTNELYFLIELE